MGSRDAGAVQAVTQDDSGGGGGGGEQEVVSWADGSKEINKLEFK